MATADRREEQEGDHSKMSGTVGTQGHGKRVHGRSIGRKSHLATEIGLFN